METCLLSFWVHWSLALTGAYIESILFTLYRYCRYLEQIGQYLFWKFLRYSILITTQKGKSGLIDLPFLSPQSRIFRALQIFESGTQPKTWQVAKYCRFAHAWCNRTLVHQDIFQINISFESDTGWPSFSNPLEPENIVEKQDRSLFMVRTEVRSKHSDSHLGHVFPDGRITGAICNCCADYCFPHLSCKTITYWKSMAADALCCPYEQGLLYGMRPMYPQVPLWCVYDRLS